MREISTEENLMSFVRLIWPEITFKGISLKVQSCKLCNTRYIITSTLINTKMFTFVPVLVFKLLSLKVLFIKRKDNRNFLKYINRRLQLSPLNDCKL